MNRLAGIPILLVAGLAIGSAWAAIPPIVVGASTTTTTTTSPVPVAPTSSSSLSVSSSLAGERPVQLTLTLHYEMQCGYPGAGTLVVKLPAQEQLPASFASTVALLDGKAVGVTLASGKELRIALPKRPGVMCDVIGPGTLKLVVTKAAKLGNPAKAGTYSVLASAGSHTFHAALQITA